MATVYINGLYRTQRLTGVQRYAREIVVRLLGSVPVKVLEPAGWWSQGRAAKHGWEQLVLPSQARNGVLWSPTNTGPLGARRQVLTLHDGAVFSHPEWFSKSYVAWRRFLLPKLVERVSKIITVSQFSKEHLLNHTKLPEEKIVVIPGGVDHRRFRKPAQEEINGVKKAYQLDTPYFLALSSLEPRKNIAGLIQAWEKCEEDLAEATLVLVGSSGSSFAQLELQSKSSRIRFLGYTPDEDLPALYSGALAFVYPSLFEGFGLPALEAMSCGTPVLTSDLAALPEVVQDAAVTVNPYDTEAIAQGLVHLFEDTGLRYKLSLAGLERAKKFSWEDCSRQVLTVLREVKE